MTSVLPGGDHSLLDNHFSIHHFRFHLGSSERGRESYRCSEFPDEEGNEKDMDADHQAHILRECATIFPPSRN